MNHVSFPSIEGFHNIVRSTTNFLAIDPPLTWPYIGYKGNIARGTAKYRGKIKLHGTNAAVRTNGTEILAQSRTAVLTTTADNKGFAQWVDKNKEYWLNVSNGQLLTIFGEWCGPGIAKGTAIQRIPHKILAVFAILIGDPIPNLTDDGPTNYENTTFIIEPDQIKAILGSHPSDVHVLPWHGEEFVLDYSSRDSLQVTVDQLNEIVKNVEPVDPWVKEVFGVEGIGEGVVYYPGIGDVCSMKFFNDFSFKAKGEKHKVVKTKEAVQIDPEVAASIDEFVSLFVTEPRLEQGLAAMGPIDIKNTGNFLKWISTDILKESEDELEASDLTWDQVQKAVQAAARKWYVSKVPVVTART